MPPDVVYSIQIHRNFRVTAFSGHQIAIKDLIPTFVHVLNRYSQLNTILQRVKQTPLNLKSLLVLLRIYRKKKSLQKEKQ